MHALLLRSQLLVRLPYICNALVNTISTMAPKINTSDSSTSGSGQKLRNERGSTHRGRYEELKLARTRIQAHNVAKEAKNAHLTK